MPHIPNPSPKLMQQQLPANDEGFNAPKRGPTGSVSTNQEPTITNRQQRAGLKVATPGDGSKECGPNNMARESTPTPQDQSTIRDQVSTHLEETLVKTRPDVTSGKLKMPPPTQQQKVGPLSLRKTKSHARHPQRDALFSDTGGSPSKLNHSQRSPGGKNVGPIRERDRSLSPRVHRSS